MRGGPAEPALEIMIKPLKISLGSFQQDLRCAFSILSQHCCWLTVFWASQGSHKLYFWWEKNHFLPKTFGTLFEQPQKKTLSGSQTDFWTTKTSRLTPRCFCWPICSFGMSALSKHSLKERKSYMVLICTFRDCEFLFRVEPFVLVGMNKSGNSQTAPAPKNAELCIMALSQPQKEKKAKRQWQMQ